MEAKSSRAKRLSRRAIAGIVCLLALVGLWIAWSQIASRRLRQTIEAIHAAHQPFELQDFQVRDLPPEDNAATYFNKAGESLSQKVESPGYSALQYPDYPPFPPEWHQMADAAMSDKDNAAAMGWARKARAHDHVNWDFDVSTTSPVVQSLRQNRKLAYLLGDGALHAHVHGNDVEAIERIRDGLHLAHAVGDRTGLTGRLVGISIEALILDRLQVILPDLRVEGDIASPTPATQASTPVRRAVLREMIENLLDDKYDRDQDRAAAMMEQLIAYNNALRIRNEATVLRPMIDLDTIRLLNMTWIELDGLARDNLPQALAVWATSPTGNRMSAASPVGATGTALGAPRYSRLLSSGYVRTNQYFWVEFAVRGARRAAAVSIAIRLYRADHQGWPPDNDALVPDYLKQVPINPLSATPTPIRFMMVSGGLPDGHDRPLLYYNSTLGKLPTPPAEPVYGWRDRNDTQWRDLARWSLPSATAPSATTAPSSN